MMEEERSIAIKVYSNAEEMGKVAAKDVSEVIRKYISEKGGVNIVFAAAPSQDQFLSSLSEIEDIEWSKVVAFHLDEYIDLPRGHPNTFEVYLNEHLFEKVKPGEIYFIKGLKGTPEEICEKYGKLISNKGGLDIACIGIGENGHIAFDEPGSSFNDSRIARIVNPDEISRQQQYNDYRNDPDVNKRYSSLKEVPKRAITLTIPTILWAKEIYVVVPGFQKSKAVKAMWEGPIDEKCPSSVLRLHSNVKLYLDRSSARLLRKGCLFKF